LESRGATRLSGGQQQRVALARAIVFQPSLLLLDEPLSNLDAKLRVHMRAELKSLQQKTGITTIYVTHDQDESMALADRIIVMNQGRIEQMGTPEEVYERPRTNFVADFVGASNLLDAQVIGAQEADGYVHLAIGEPRQTIHCLPPTDGERLEKGQWVLVSLRPEKLGLHVEPPPGAVNVWECRVEAAMYSGDHREYQLSVGDQVLKVSAPVSPALAKGDNVYAVIDPREPVLLAAEGAP
jgi:iron(III) transport system ATP-binding protein